VRLAERTVGTLRRRLGFVRLSVRRDTPATMPKPRWHTKKLRRPGPAAIPPQARGKPVELWWQDEARIGQQGTLTRVWAAKGRPVRRRLAISATLRPICSAPFARRAASAPPWCCRSPTATR